MIRHTLSEWCLIALLTLYGMMIIGCSQGIAATQDISSTPIYPTSTFLPVVTKPPIVPSPIATINLPQPTDIVINPQTGKVYILAGYTQVAILTGTGPYELLELEGANSEQMALDVSEDVVYVTHEVQEQKSITVIQGNQIFSRLDIPLDEIRDLTVHPDTHELHIIGFVGTSEEGLQAKLIVTNKSEILKTIDFEEILPQRIAIDPIFKKIYIGGLRLGEDGSFTTIGTLTIVGETGEIQQLDLGQSVLDIAIDPNTGNTYVVYIPDYEDGIAQEDLTLIRDGAVITSIQVTDGPITADTLRVHPTTSDVYVLNPAAWQVSVVHNTNDQLEVIGTAPVGSGAVHIAIDPITGNVYVANFNDDTVSVLNGTQAIATIDVGWYPFGIAVNPQNGWVYVSNTNDSTISVLGYDE